MAWIIVGVALPWIVVAFGCWLGVQFLRQNGRLLLRLDALEERLAGQQGQAPAAPPAPSGLALGSEAPAFSVPDLQGRRHPLRDFRGRRLLLIFFNPRCGYCSRMAGDLAALPTDGAGGRPLPVVLSTGDLDANRALVAEHNIRCPYLVQEGSEVTSSYQATGTPMGYLVDEDGRIASRLTVGADALLALAGTGRPRAEQAGGGVPPASDVHDGHPEHRGNRSLADSKLNRNGLAVGTPAPDFTLPSLDGEERSLADYRGKRVLLVFSDPHCGPCNELAPRLERLHRREADLQVVIISRGEPEANRAKAEEHGLTFPILLQKRWEISKSYAMFATPVGYLIDEEGIIAAKVAVGPDPILSLPAQVVARSEGAARKNGKGAAPRRGKAVGARALARGLSRRRALLRLVPRFPRGAPTPDAAGAFDALTRALAEELPRREAMRRAGAGLAAVLLSSLGLDAAWGAPKGPKEPKCKKGFYACADGHCCPVGQSCCGSLCCPAGSLCCGGVCCNLGQTCCAGAGGPYCATLGSNTNCSACGDACPTGTTCVGGTCGVVCAVTDKGDFCPEDTPVCCPQDSPQACCPQDTPVCCPQGYPAACCFENHHCCSGGHEGRCCPTGTLCVPAGFGFGSPCCTPGGSAPTSLGPCCSGAIVDGKCVSLASGEACSFGAQCASAECSGGVCD